MKNAVICLCLALCLFACNKKDDGKVLVTINDDKVTMTEFNKELDRIPMNMKMMVASESGKKAYLDRLIIKKLLLAEAQKANVEKDKEFENKLAEIREQLIIESLLKKKLTAGANITDDDLQKYYDKNKDKFRKDTEINTRHILVKSEEEAKQVREKLQAGEDFTELAKKYSIDPNAKVTGGEVGFPPGYHIIRLEGIKPPTYVPFAEVKEFIKQQLMQEKQKEVLDKYIEELKKSAKITINEDLLKDQAPSGPAKPEAKDAKPEAKVTKPEAKYAPSDKPAGTKTEPATPPKKDTVPQSK